MCRKLVFVLAMAAMVSTVLAVNVNDTFQETNGSTTLISILKVDIDAQGNTGPNDTQVGWEAWEMDGYYGPLGAQLKNFDGKICQLEGYTWSGGAGNLGGSRDRVDDTINDNSDFGGMLSDLAYVAHTTSGMGKDYIKLTIRLGAAYANRNLDVSVWSWDPAFAGSGLYGGAGEPEGSKVACWSTTNPSQWLTDNGYDPNGYGYSSTPGESNMPAGLAALVGDSAIQLGTAPWLSDLDGAHGNTFASTVNVNTDSIGRVILYGWADMLYETGSQHIAINGFAVSVPEPATIALLGLGGLALIRRKR